MTMLVFGSGSILGVAVRSFLQPAFLCRRGIQPLLMRVHKQFMGTTTFDAVRAVNLYLECEKLDGRGSSLRRSRQVGGPDLGPQSGGKRRR